MSQPTSCARSNLRRHRLHPAGMTLVELLVVIAILGLLASLLPLAIQHMVPSRRLAAAAQSLCADLRDLQASAAARGRALQITLTPSGYSLPRKPEAEAARVAWPDGISATLRAHEAGPMIRTLTMYPDGSSSGGEFELHAERHLARVLVSPLTGRVRVSR